MWDWDNNNEICSLWFFLLGFKLARYNNPGALKLLGTTNV